MNETIAVNSFGVDHEDDLCNGLKDGNTVSVPLSDGGIPIGEVTSCTASELPKFF